jgi:hypothetical protein
MAISKAFSRKRPLKGRFKGTKVLCRAANVPRAQVRASSCRTWNTGNVYQVTLPLLNPGVYQFTVTGEDQDGAQTVNPAANQANQVRQFEVEAVGTNRAPTISLTGPANQTAIVQSASVTLSANANAGEVNGSIGEVRF